MALLMKARSRVCLADCSYVIIRCFASFILFHVYVQRRRGCDPVSARSKEPYAHRERNRLGVNFQIVCFSSSFFLSTFPSVEDRIFRQHAKLDPNVLARRVRDFWMVGVNFFFSFVYWDRSFWIPIDECAAGLLVHS